MTTCKRYSYRTHHLLVEIVQENENTCYVNVMEDPKGPPMHALTPSEFGSFVDLLGEMRTKMYAEFNTTGAGEEP